ncbi:MAG: di-trans,poly-cis-decaprenylcistransferase [Oscillospiraceae bacterium]|nr:di-trans,poly-cis-decaprenylcistransferase [Oscillospiraceae bacterium]
MNTSDGKTLTVPRHVGIIMDGNGRWAERHAFARAAGHKQGAEAFRTLAYYCRDIGMDYLSVYAFSTENWKRDKLEVSAILRILEDYLIEAIEKMAREGLRMRILGDTAPLSERLKRLIGEAHSIADTYEGFTANLCVNYGGRDEILRAAKKAAESGAAFEDCLDTAGLPDPELIIRPGGEHRLSNFMLWQSAYSELYFTDTLWPDFEPADLDAAIVWYNQRERRFGGR